MMKKLGIYIFFGLMALSACNLVQLERRSFITTGNNDSLDYTNALIKGVMRDVSNRNASKITQHGHCWDTLLNPTAEEGKNFTQLGEKTSAGAYSSKLTGLIPGKKYFTRGYFIDSKNGVVYGENFEFIAPQLTTLVVIPTSTSATATGTVDIVASNPITEHGHCWSVNAEPTISDSLSKLGAKTDSTEFKTTINNLTVNQVYYIRAYIITAKDTLYGRGGQFTTF